MVDISIPKGVEIGSLLSEMRDAANLTQQQIAATLGFSQSRISRMEQGGGSTDYADYERYLMAVGTPRAAQLLDALRVSWKRLSVPSLRHPDLDILIEAEAALARLDNFRQGPTVPQVLAGQADLLYRRLLEFGEFLLRLDHKVVYVGDIGVGKTTAACRQAGLVIDTVTAADLKGMLLDTGGGRTTLCEVIVQRGERFEIKVDPLSDEEVYRLVAELCRATRERLEEKASSSTTSDYKPPEEVERALRNMANLSRPQRRKGMTNVVDPAIQLAETSASLDEFIAEVASRLTLWRRTRRSIEFDGSDVQAGRHWLRETFTAINNGRHPDFTLPGRINVTVPFSPIADTPFDMSLVDTRGVDGSAIRPDIVAQMKDRRALSILCSKWGSAPDTSLQDVLKHVTDTDVDPALFSRIVILVLARSGDALSMRHDSGESVENALEGYEIKEEHVKDALQRINLLSINVTVFDAASDDPAELSKFLCSKIVALRVTQAESARQTINAIEQMLKNVQQATAIAALTSINNELIIFSKRHKVLGNSRKPLHLRLSDGIRSRHARTVWAATRRAGSFWNFDVYQLLGDGAAADAKRRASGAVSGLREIISNKLSDQALETAHSFLGQVLDNVDGWEADFVQAARHHALAVLKPALSADSDLWNACEAQYGRGLVYKEEVVSLLETWFEKHKHLEEEIDARVQRAWRASVLKPLRTAAGLQPPSSPTMAEA